MRFSYVTEETDCTRDIKA